MVVEPLAVFMSVKFVVRKSVSMKFAVVKPAMGKARSPRVKSARPTVEPAARKSTATVKAGALNSLAIMNSGAAVRSRLRRSGLQERGGEQQCS